jgi:Domain of unknown function (DUF6431)
VAIVWPCPDPVDVYAAAGRAVVVPRPDCPRCGRAMGFWSGYRRSVRAGGVCHRLWIRRGKCGPCAQSHALIPSFVLVGRLDGVEAIGDVIDAVAAGRSGVRTAAENVDVPHTTARDWVRRFCSRADMWLGGFGSLCVELGGRLPWRWPDTAPVAATTAIGLAWAAASARHGPHCPGRWAFAGLVSGGMLLSTTTNPPWSVFGNRRFMPPAPLGAT